MVALPRHACRPEISACKNRAGAHVRILHRGVAVAQVVHEGREQRPLAVLGVILQAPGDDRGTYATPGLKAVGLIHTLGMQDHCDFNGVVPPLTRLAASSTLAATRTKRASPQLRWSTTTSCPALLASSGRTAACWT
jgi:hypothetical protein